MLDFLQNRIETLVHKENIIQRMKEKKKKEKISITGKRKLKK